MKLNSFVTPLLVLGCFAALSIQGHAKDMKIKNPVVGVQPLALSVDEKAVLPTGLSVKKSIMDNTVYNSKGEKVGKVTDLIVSTDEQVSFVVIGAGGFLGLGVHDVAVPVRFISVNNEGKILFPNGTKEALMDLPRFRYSK